ncbi:hypothetical protein HGA91_04415 [candidate division WWE3 bacterium]|nr:hypothetical protein [candidate division WWE3 bacterium]
MVDVSKDVAVEDMTLASQDRAGATFWQIRYRIAIRRLGQYHHNYAKDKLETAKWHTQKAFIRLLLALCCLITVSIFVIAAVISPNGSLMFVAGMLTIICGLLNVGILSFEIVVARDDVRDCSERLEKADPQP